MSINAYVHYTDDLCKIDAHDRTSSDAVCFKHAVLRVIFDRGKNIKAEVNSDCTTYCVDCSEEDAEYWRNEEAKVGEDDDL